MRASEDLGRAGDVARGHEVANAAGGPTAPVADVRQGEDLEAVLGAEPAQRDDVAGVANTEPGVLPTTTTLAPSALTNTSTTKRSGGPLGELAGELHDQHGVQSGGREQVEALVGRGDDLRRPLRVKDGDRVRVERDRDRLGAVRASPLHDGGQHCVMALVHAVEVAQRHHARAVALGDLGEVGPSQHEGHSTNPTELNTTWALASEPLSSSMATRCPSGAKAATGWLRPAGWDGMRCP